MTAENPPAQDTADAADLAGRHIDAAVKALRDGYAHPHHSPRLDQITQQLSGIKGLIAELPQSEANRAEYADRLMSLHKARQLPLVLPDHAELLLSQELERTT